MAGAAGLAQQAAAQTAWPMAKPITLIVPVATGGSADQVARAVAAIVSRKLGATVVVKNVVGGGGVTGFAEVAASAPDGYTFGTVNVGSLLVLPHVQKMPFGFDSFSFLGVVSMAWNGVGVGANSPLKSTADLIALGKQRPIVFTTSTPMQGIAMIQLATLSGIKVRMVLTSTQTEAISQAIGGHVDCVVQSAAEMIPLIEGKELRLITSVAVTRWPNYPDVPTLMEQGFDAADIVLQGYALPAGVPADIRKRLGDIVATAADEPELVETLKKNQIAPMKMNGDAFLAALKEQAPVVEKMLVDAGMKKT